jgi:AcrR family transcriptional regulator
MVSPLLSVTRFDSLEDEELWSHVDSPASRRLLVAALDCFAKRGYHGTTTRQIANQAGLSPGAVYVHYASKGDLLYQIIKLGHDSAFEALEASANSGIVDSMERMQAIVWSFATWHAKHHRLARVAQYELAALPEARRPEIRRLRARFSARLEDEITAGVATGAFGPVDVEGVALAILSLCIDIARWYGPHSHRAPAALGDLYAEIVARALRAAPVGRTT